MEGKSIATIDIALPFKMKHISNIGRGGASTTYPIPIHHICVDEGGDFGINDGTDDAENYIVLSSSSSCCFQTTNQTKEEILQRRVANIALPWTPIAVECV